MAQTNKILGVTDVTIGSKTYRQRKGATFNPGGVKRTTKPGNKRMNGYSEEIVPSTLDFDIDVGGETSLAEINAMSDETVRVRCDTGQEYVVNGMWVTEPAGLDEGDGKSSIKMEGQPAQELS